MVRTLCLILYILCIVLSTDTLVKLTDNGVLYAALTDTDTLVKMAENNVLYAALTDTASFVYSQDKVSKKCFWAKSTEC